MSCWTWKGQAGRKAALEGRNNHLAGGVGHLHGRDIHINYGLWLISKKSCILVHNKLKSGTNKRGEDENVMRG